MKYLKPTPALIAEYRAQSSYVNMEQDIRTLSLPDGHKDATRLQRVKDRRTGKERLTMTAPWLLMDVFSI